jgi:hypothetical protein
MAKNKTVRKWTRNDGGDMQLVQVIQSLGKEIWKKESKPQFR